MVYHSLEIHLVHLVNLAVYLAKYDILSSDVLEKITLL